MDVRGRGGLLLPPHSSYSTGAGIMESPQETNHLEGMGLVRWGNGQPALENLFAYLLAPGPCLVFGGLRDEGRAHQVFVTRRETLGSWKSCGESHTSLHLHRHPLAQAALTSHLDQCSSLPTTPGFPSCLLYLFLYSHVSCCILPSSLFLLFPEPPGHRAFAPAVSSVRDALPFSLHLGFTYPFFRCQLTAPPKGGFLGCPGQI